MRIATEKLLTVRQIVCHRYPDRPCSDGVASAILLRDALPHLEEIRFVTHGVELLELPPSPSTLFCDIAPPEERAIEWARAGAIVLDHHKTARELVEKFAAQGLGVFADEATEPGVSGAVLAFREVWKPLVGAGLDGVEYAAAKWFAKLAGIRDTWQRSDPNWRAACVQHEALSFWPWVRWPSRPFAVGSAMGLLLEIGEPLLEQKEHRTKILVSKAWEGTSRKGTRLLILSSKETSDAAELVGEKFDLVVGFGYAVDPAGYPELSLSLRSHTTFDCAAFCKAHGGGGHTRAAGCAMLLESDDRQPYTAIRDLIDAWEARTP